MKKYLQLSRSTPRLHCIRWCDLKSLQGDHMILTWGCVVGISWEVDFSCLFEELNVKLQSLQHFPKTYREG